MTMELQLETNAHITWCPGCTNAQLLVAFREALTELVLGGTVAKENVVAVAGIGCHGKITDYLQMNTYTSLHGRVVPALEGIKLGNPALTVIGFEGDGDAYAEGIAHLIHAARRNNDINLFVHNNMVFALTASQATPTSPKGFKGRSSAPEGNVEEPLDPLLLMLAAGATFVARTYVGDIARTKEVMKAAIAHKGFSFVDIIQPCITFLDTRDSYRSRITWVEAPAADFPGALRLMAPTGDTVPCGVFYQVQRPTLDEMLS